LTTFYVLGIRETNENITQKWKKAREIFSQQMERMREYVRDKLKSREDVGAIHESPLQRILSREL
jgi:hypothetical protein